jgi:hypothetical protein
MTAVLTKNLWHSMPGWGIVANLLPPELLEARRANAVRRLVAFGAIVVLVLALLGFGYAKWRAHSASDGLTRAQDTTQSLMIEQRKYNEVVQIQGTLSQVQSQIRQLMGNDVQFANLDGTLRANLLPGMAISQLTAAINAGIAAGAATPATGSGANSGSVLNTAPAKAIGTITITGTAVHFSDVSGYVDRLGAVKGITSVYPISNAVTEGGVQFSLQITITDLSLSHRYDTTTTGGK